MNKKKIIKWILFAPVMVIALYLIAGFFHFFPFGLVKTDVKIPHTYSLEVIFEKDINYQEAKEIIKSYDLEFNKEYNNTSSSYIGERTDYLNRGVSKAREGKEEEDFNKMHMALVDVPKGEEKEWKQTLVADSKIEDAVIVPIPVEPSFFQKTIAIIKLHILYIYGVGFIIGDIVFQNKTPQSAFFSYLLFFLIIALLIIWIIKRKSKDKRQN